MNIKLAVSILGKILIFIGCLMVAPIIVGFIYREPMGNIFSFLLPMIGLIILGIFLSKRYKTRGKLTVREGFFIVSMTWISASIFGSLPFVISGEIPKFIDAIFETASGFTTTGATILTDVEALSQSMLFWRSFSHFIGGMGILVFVLAILPNTEQGAVNIMKAEVPGPVFGKLVSKVSISAKILYIMYIAMTVGLILILMIAGMKPFDAIIHSFGVAGTGGFSNKAASIGYYQSPAIEYIISIGMIAFGINFNLYYMLILKKFKDIWRDEELRLYLGVILVAIILICLNLAPIYDSVSTMIRHVFFTVTSIVSTTGYSTVDFNKWPLFSHIIIMTLMFTGSMAGSTAGGFKMSRVLRLLKSGLRELKLAINPRRIIIIQENGVPADDENLKSTYVYLVLYLLVIFLVILVVSLENQTLETTVSTAMTIVNNVGPGFEMVGPTGSFANYSGLTKLVLTAGMIIGRLEIIPILVLFNYRTWKKTR